MSRNNSSASRKKESASDRVVNSLMDKLAANEWQPGDRLPAENDLAEMYGVSRITVRMALNTLSTIGVIETRNGGGSYVKKFRFSDITNSAAKAMLNQVNTSDMNAYRRVIETASLEALRGRKLLSSDVKYLRGCVSRMQTALGNNLKSQEMINADFDFHRHICSMSGNKLFVYSYDMIASVMTAYFREHYYTIGRTDYDGRVEMGQWGINLHVKIIDALVNGRVDDALAVIRDMTENDTENRLPKSENGI